jgi:hypothetical protein
LIALKRSLLVISLFSLVSCLGAVPEFPEIWQCGYSSKFNKFRCVNSKTGEAKNLKRDDPSMEGSQCLSVNDYRLSERWVDTVIKIAESRCR